MWIRIKKSTLAEYFFYAPLSTTSQKIAELSGFDPPIVTLTRVKKKCILVVGHSTPTRDVDRKNVGSTSLFFTDPFAGLRNKNKFQKNGGRNLSLTVESSSGEW